VETDGPGGNDEYGLTTHLHLCRPGGREVRVENHGGGIAVGVESVTSASHYIGFREVFTDVACSKYQGDGCSSARLIAYDMATGRRRSVVGVGPAFVLTDSGWLAWLADGTVRARVAGATRTLDAGPVDAASLTATGTTVSWTRGGAPQSADLG
jgi:hypothetical protein